MKEEFLLLGFFAILFLFLCFIYRIVSLERTILSYLKQNYAEKYKQIASNYSVKNILIGNPEVAKNQVKQWKALLSREIGCDETIRSLQRKFRKAHILALITIGLFILFAIVVYGSNS